MLTRWIALAGCLLAMTSYAQAPTLTPHQAEYKVSISGVSGRLNTVLDVDEQGHYTAIHSIKPTGIARLIAGSGRIREQSEFSIDDTFVVVSEYHSVDQISRDKGEIRIAFDHDEQTLTGRIALEDQTPVEVDAEFAAPLFDRVSVQYQLMLDLKTENQTTDAEETPTEAVERDRYAIFDPDGQKTLEITNIGQRNVKVGRKRYDVVGVRHQSPGSSRKTELWLAPELDYLPVLIEQYRKEKLRLRATLREYRPTT
ncbi:MAG: DUF3108 domain-containing protein [Pseudomonadota bacterium]